jgi:hypothetical protein
MTKLKTYYNPYYNPYHYNPYNYNPYYRFLPVIMLSTSVKRILLKALKRTKYDITTIGVSDKFNDLTMHELVYRKSRIYSDTDKYYTYEQLRYMTDDDKILKCNEKEITDMFKRSHLDEYGFNTANGLEYKLTYGNRSAIFMFASTSLLWVDVG